VNAIEDLAYGYNPYVMFYNLYSKVATKFCFKVVLYKSF
jgi:hypothetical protein